MRKSVLVAALLSVTLASGCASNNSANVQKTYVNATILKIESASDICSSNGAGEGSPLFGAIAGGVVGNQFGGGKGRVLMTVFGAGAGAMMMRGDERGGSKLECRSNGYLATMEYVNPQTYRTVKEDVPIENYIRSKKVNVPVCLYQGYSKVCL